MTVGELSRIVSVDTLEELYDVIQQDFYIIQPCIRRQQSQQQQPQPQKVMEGTRLTLVRHEPEGFDFTIRTPGTPMRWIEFDEELHLCFENLVDVLVEFVNYCSNYAKQKKSNVMTIESGSNIDELLVKIKKNALELFYLWVIFAPLTRGTATCGYIALLASLQTVGLTLNRSGLPRNIQLDWEAIFSSTFDEFYGRVSGWFQVVCSVVPLQETETKTETENMQSILPRSNTSTTTTATTTAAATAAAAAAAAATTTQSLLDAIVISSSSLLHDDSEIVGEIADIASTFRDMLSLLLVDASDYSNQDDDDTIHT